MIPSTDETSEEFQGINFIGRYWNPMDSSFIDEDVKQEFKGKSYEFQAMVMVQMIKTMKELIKKLEDQK